jgi:probable F420-dependent oxidoreductase
VTLRFAVSYQTATFGIDPDAIAAYARHAEACGFEALFVPEHVALYPGAAVGSWKFEPTLPFADPLELLTFVAAVTDRIVLGTGVLLLPYHHPVTLAKRLATLDALSKGRMRLLTIGVGALPGEAAAVGVDFATRGRRADEAIDVLRLVWAGDEKGVSHHGDFFDFDDVVSYPKPLGDGPLPIHIGGSSRAAARRAGLRGNGYFPGGMLSPQERQAQLDLARSTARDAGRDPDALEYTRWGSLDLTDDQIEQLVAEGVTRVIVGPTAKDPAEQRDQLSAFADRVGLTTSAATAPTTPTTA